jgi:putative hydrolase of the HAD superfamily
VRTVAAKAVVFDVDDTLYLERDYVRSGFGAVGEFARQRWNLTDVAERAWELFLQNARGDIFQRVLRSAGIEPTAADIELLVRCYREHAPQISLLDDALHALECASDGFLAVVTDGPSSSQHAKIRALNLKRWARKLIVTADHGPSWTKPSLSGFSAIEAASGCKGPDCVYIGDNPLKDFAGPQQLGWQTIRIRRPGGLHAQLESKQDVQAEFTSFHDFSLKLLDGL